MNKTLAERSKKTIAKVARLRVSEILENDGIDLVQEITRLARKAESEGDISTAINAYTKLLPFVHVKPRDHKTDKSSQGVTINLIDHKPQPDSYNMVMDELAQIDRE